MNISKDIRSLLHMVAKDFAKAEGVIAGHVHFLAALSHISGSLRQEFDRIVTGGLFHEDSEQPAAAEPAPASEPAPAATEQPVEPEPAPAPEVAVVAEPTAEPTTEPAAPTPEQPA